MTLPSHESFTTDDPDALKEELELAYQGIAAEIMGLLEPREWITQDALETVVAARVDGAVVVLDANVTVLPPADAEPGQCFRVVRAGTGNATIRPDDGTLVDGAASAVVNAAGYREFMFSRGGWWAHL